MSRRQRRVPVLDLLPEAYFVGEKGLSGQTFSEKKKTTEMAWDNVYITAEEIAVITVIPEQVFNDSEYDMWAQIRPAITNAIGRKVDFAMLNGVPGSTSFSTWPKGILVGMPDDHKIELGSVGDDLYDDLLAVGGVFNKVEEDGYFVNGNIGAIRMRAHLRGLRDEKSGQPIFQRSMQDATLFELDGSPIYFPRNAVIDPTEVLLVSGDWNELVYAIREDITYKVFDTGVVTDDSSLVVANLMQEDLVAIRVTFRIGWALPNPVNIVNPDNETRFPFASLIPAEAGSG